MRSRNPAGGSALSRFSWILLAAFLIVPASAGAAKDLAGELEPARAAMEAGDTEKAYQEYLRFAEQGNQLAQFSLALFHQLGWGRPVDQAEACRWHGKAAEGEIPMALQSYADCLRQGTHQAPDPAAAATYYERAANRGLPINLCTLAELYMTGEGVAKDPRRAVELCGQAAQHGIEQAQVRQALLLLEGDESVRDPRAAAHWLHLAAQVNNAEAQFRLAELIRAGDGVEANPETARFWFESAAAQGYLPAYFPTGQLYFDGAFAHEEGDPHRDPELAKAYLWLSATAARGEDPEEHAKTRQMLSALLTVMPVTWRPELDATLEAHLAQFAPATE